MNKLSWLLAGIVIGTAAFVLILASPGAKAWTSGDSYSGSGDWTINNPTVVGDDGGITVNGNLIINSRLEVYQSIIRINSGSDNQYMVNVTSTGNLMLYGSSLTATNGNYHYSFLAWGSLDINQSAVSEMWGDTSGASWAGGIQIYKSGAQVRNSNIYNGRTGGIYIYNAAATVNGCNIYSNGAGGGSTTYCYGIYMANDGLGTTTSTQIDGNSIYGNTYISGVMRYGYGVYSQFQSSTDTITNNRIYDNGFTMNQNSQGTQLRLQWSNATVTDNFLGNGSYQLYVWGSSPPQFKNLNISSYAYSSYTTYGVYGDNSTLNFKNCAWYMFNGMGTIYGVRAYGPSVNPMNSTSKLDFTDCTWNYSMSGSAARYLVYATTWTPINVTGCTFTTVYGSTVQMIYANTYSPINITSSAFNMSLNTASPSFVYVSTWSNVNILRSTFEATGSFQGSSFFYGTSYCNWSVFESRVDIWLPRPTSSYTYYGFEVRTYGATWLSKSIVNFTIDNLSSASSPNFYPIYNRNTLTGGFGVLALDNCTVNIVWPATCTTSSGQLYCLYAYYTPLFINRSTIYSLNETLRGSSYGIYAYYQSCTIDNSTVIFSKIHGSGGYGIYSYGQSNQNFYLNITNSVVITNYTIPGNLYSTSSAYCYCYYNGLNIINSRFEIIGGYYAQFYTYAYGGNKNAVIINSDFTMRCTVESRYYQYQYAYFYLYYFSNVYMDRVNVNLTAAYYCYMYTYGQSGQNNYLNITNCTFNVNNYIPGYYQYSYCYFYTYYYANTLIENNVYNIDFGYYMYNIIGYSTNATVRWNTYNLRQYAYGFPSLQGYLFYFPGRLSSGVDYFTRMENCTIDYKSYGQSSSGPTMFYVYDSRTLVQNVTVKVRNYNGTVPVNVAYVYYGGKLDMENVLLDAEFGTDSPGGGMPGFNLAYIYNSASSYPPAVFNLTDSTWKVKLATDSFLHNGFYIYGTNDEVNIINSTVRWNITAPGATLRVFRFYDDPSGPGKLNKLNLAGSKIIVDVNGPDAQVFILKMGQGTYIGKINVAGSEISANFYAASSLPINLIEVVGVKEFTLADIGLNMNAPAGSNMVMNGVRLQQAEATVTNMVIKGNGQGRLTGIMCDLATRGTITNVTITNCHAGIASLFFSEPTITGVDISGCTYGILVNSSGNGTLTGENKISATVIVGLQDESWINIIDTILPATGTTDIELDMASTAWCLAATFNENKVVFKDYNSTLIVNQKLQLNVFWKSAAGVATAKPVPNAGVVLKNAMGAEYMRATTSEDGVVPWFTAAEYVRVAAGKTTFTPYTVLLDYRGFKGESSVAVTKTTNATLYLVDDSLPEVSITEPKDGRIQNYRDVLVTGTAGDLGSGLDVLSISFDGTNWLYLPATALWATILDIPEGEYTITALVTDLAGNSAEAKVKVIIDLTPPVIKISSPADNSLGNQIGVSIVGTVEKGSTLTVNRRPVSVDANGAFSYGVRLVEGRNEFFLFATDLAGNTNSLSWTLLLDITPPPLVLTGPVDGLLTNQKTVTVSGKTEPGAAVTLNKVAIEVKPDGSFSVSLELKSGPNPIEVVASDIAGNTASGLRTVVLDNEIRLKVTYPYTDRTVETNQITILAQGTTDTDVLLRLNDGLVTVASDGNFSVTYTLNEGPNELIFSAVDRAGNSALSTCRVVLDTVRPTLEILSPQAGTVLRTAEVTVNGSCEPGITLTINGGDPVPTGTGMFSKTLSLPEGASIISIEGRDGAGNTVSVQIPVLIDRTEPPLEIVEPSSGFRTREFSVMVVGITEPGASVTVNGLPVMVDPFGKFTTTVTLQKGKNDIKVSAGDGAGNGVSKSITVTGTTEPGQPATNTWWWAAAGLVMAIGIMLPLTALLVNIAVKGRKGQEGSK